MSTPSASPNRTSSASFGRQTRRRQRHAGGVDPLALAERRAVHHASCESPRHHSRSPAGRSGRRPAAGPGPAGRRAPAARRSWRPDPGCPRNHRWRSQFITAPQRDRGAAREAARPDLRAAQVLQHGNDAPGPIRSRTQPRIGRGVCLVRTVREIEPEHVDAREHQLVERRHRCRWPARAWRRSSCGAYGPQLTIGFVMGQIIHDAGGSVSRRAASAHRRGRSRRSKPRDARRTCRSCSRHPLACCDRS